MAATVVVKQVVGASPGSASTITNLRMNTDDTVNPGTVNPLVKPAAGTNYSFIKTVYLNADTTPAGTINNVKIYSDGTIGWTGVTLFVGSNATYHEAEGTVGTTATLSTVATANVETFTSGAAKQLT